MTPQKQRIAIAEACGWKGPFQLEWLREYGREGEDVWEMCGTNPEGERAPFPDYLNDLNAMHQVEKVIVPSSEYTLSSYMFELSKIVIPAGSTRRGLISEYIFHATAAQRAEAFLRTIGKWEE